MVRPLGAGEFGLRNMKHIYKLGWTLFQTMFGGRNSMSRSTFGSHNDKKKR